MTTTRFSLFPPQDNVIDPVAPKLAAPVPDSPTLHQPIVEPTDSHVEIVKNPYLPYTNPYQSKLVEDDSEPESRVKKKQVASPRYVEIVAAEHKQESTTAVETQSQRQESTSAIEIQRQEPTSALSPPFELKLSPSQWRELLRPLPEEPASLRSSPPAFSETKIEIIPEFYNPDDAMHPISPRHKLLLQTLRNFAEMRSKKFKKEGDVHQLRNDIHNIIEYKQDFHATYKASLKGEDCYPLKKLQLELENGDDFLLDQIKVLEDFYYADQNDDALSLPSENVSEDEQVKVGSTQEATLFDEIFKEVTSGLVAESRLDLETPIKEYLAATFATFKQTGSFNKSISAIVEETKKRFRIAVVSAYEGLTPEEEKLCNAVFHEVVYPGLFKDKIEAEIKRYIAVRIKQERSVGIQAQSFAERVAEVKKHFYISELLLMDPRESKSDGGGGVSMRCEDYVVSDELRVRPGSGLYMTPKEDEETVHSISGSRVVPAPLSPSVYTASLLSLIASVNAGSGENNENINVNATDNGLAVRLRS